MPKTSVDSGQSRKRADLAHRGAAIRIMAPDGAPEPISIRKAGRGSCGWFKSRELGRLALETPRTRQSLTGHAMRH